MSKIGRIGEKINEKFDQALEGMNLTDPEQAKDASERDDPDQEYYEARLPEQVQEGGMVVFNREQVEEQAQVDGGPEPTDRGSERTDDETHDDRAEDDRAEDERAGG